MMSTGNLNIMKGGILIKFLQKKMLKGVYCLYF